MIKFDAKTNERLFGAEDAENENPERFKEYFFSTRFMKISSSTFRYGY